MLQLRAAFPKLERCVKDWGTVFLLSRTLKVFIDRDKREHPEKRESRITRSMKKDDDENAT